MIEADNQIAEVRSMTNRRSLSFLLAVSFMVVVCTSVAAQEKEPVYHGMTVSEWIARLKDPHANVREEAADTLGRIGPDAKGAAPALAHTLKDEDIAARRAAARALRLIGVGARLAVPALIDALKDRNEYVRAEVFGALGQIGPEAKAAVPALAETLKDGNF
jgi:HEAT repeat protein